MSEPTSYRCRHIFTEGRQCGSPALRGEPLCFYHHGSRHPITHEVIHGTTFVVLPAPEDLHAIQRGLCEVMRLCANHQIDHKHAAVLLRGLSICSANLARIARQQRNAPPVELVQDYVRDPVLGNLATGPDPVQEDEVRPPLPDYVPILTPKPILTYTPPTPEETALNDARWAKVEAEFAAHVIANPRVRQVATPRLEPQPDQTYPAANEDFGLKEKIINLDQLSVAPEESMRSLFSSEPAA